MSKPHVPPLSIAAELPPLTLAEGVEAFEVHEVPQYEASGEGPHWYVRFEKRGQTTRDAVRALADASGTDARDIGVAGQKDKYAVTTQWASVPDSAPEPSTWDTPPWLRILEVSRHGNKLRTGHVSANRFRLTFEGDAEEAFEPVQGVVGAIAERGLANYFGPQRFGRGGDNVAKALAWARGERSLRGRDRKFKTKLYASVLQSDVFNRYVTARLALDAPLLEGEVVRLDGSRSVFVVEDPAAEAHRLASGDIVATGPMFGPKMREAAGEAAKMEAAALAELGLEPAAAQVVGRFAPGTRRDVRVRVDDARAELAGPRALVVEFTLPAGSYATQLARELTRRPWESPLRPLDDA